MRVHLFLISSPLQAITAENIKLQHLSSETAQFYAYCEGERLSKLLSGSTWDKIVIGKNTRPSTEDAKSNLRFNLEQIKSLIPNKFEKIVLYISDLSWLFNNLSFAYLKKNFNSRLECCFLDEGTVTYRSNVFSFKEKMLALIKYAWLIKEGFPAYRLKTHPLPLELNIFKKLYCYHPALVKRREKLQAKITSLDPSFLLKSELSDVAELDNQSVLFLSQPYYRVMSEEDYEACINRMVNYFKTQGYKKFFVKPHDADSASWLNKLEQNNSMRVFFDIQSVPVEKLAPYLKCGVVVSVCSSSLLNIKLFGFKGRVVSYGLDTCAVSKSIKTAHNQAKHLYAQLGVETLF